MNAHSLLAAVTASGLPLVPDRRDVDTDGSYRDRADCERLLMACYSLMDRGHYGASADLFAADATWVRDEGTLRGRDAILASLNRRPPHDLSRHFITTVVVTPMGDYAEATAYMMTLQGSRAPNGPPPVSGPVAAYDLAVRFRRNEDWEITHLGVTQAFMPAAID